MLLDELANIDFDDAKTRHELNRLCAESAEKTTFGELSA